MADHLSDFRWGGDRPGEALEGADGCLHCRHHSNTHVMWVSTLGNHLKAISSDRTGEGGKGWAEKLTSLRSLGQVPIAIGPRAGGKGYGPFRICHRDKTNKKVLPIKHT